MDTCVIIAEVTVDGDTTILGCMADSVLEVLDLMPAGITPAGITPAPRIGTNTRTEFIAGMGKRDDRFIILLDVDKVFSAEELSVVETGGR